LNRNVYGQAVTITLLKKIRDNKQFDSQEALIDQMKADKEEALRYFSQIKK